MFYIYRIFGQGGETLYLGKGSGKRLENQIKRFGERGEVIKNFDNERETYTEEARLIFEERPPFNRTVGGFGGRYRFNLSKDNRERVLMSIITLTKQATNGHDSGALPQGGAGAPEPVYVPKLHIWDVSYFGFLSDGGRFEFRGERVGAWPDTTAR